MNICPCPFLRLLTFLTALLTAGPGLLPTARAAPAGTAITYQGRLTDNGAAAGGAYDFTVYLHTAPDSQSAIGQAAAAAVPVENGVFTLSLDFGQGAFDGTARWIEIHVLKTGEAGTPAVLTPRQEIKATPYALMALKVPDGSITGSKLAAGAVGASQLAAGAITPDKLAPGAASQNLQDSGQSPVASGGIVLSPSATALELLQTGYIQVGKVDLIAEKWLQWPYAPEPVAPVDATAKAIWTGSVYLVWGGGSNSGGRYNPTTNAWSAMSTVNAPAARSGHSAVWTGTEMIVWGGTGVVTGGRYNPTTDTWTATSTTNAPAARVDAPAVWTGTEMIVWGGGNRTDTNTGGRYNPSTNTWQTVTTTGAPEARYGHIAVWTGSRLIVGCGGKLVSGQYEVRVGTAGSYNPATNAWAALPDGPLTISPAAVWTGSYVLITGGYMHDYGSTPSLYSTNTASRFSPSTNTWTALAYDPALARYQHSAVWTGTEMLVWGGYQPYYGQGAAISNGSRYNLATNTWTALAPTGAPAERANHSAAWTGSRMLIYGGGQPIGGRYDLSTNTWSPMAGLTERSARTESTHVWTGRELLIWGGLDETGITIQNGLRYNPSTGQWTTISSIGAPVARRSHSAIWTGTKMIVWGGRNDTTYFADGAAYDPVTDTWMPVGGRSAPSSRIWHRAVWTGTEMIIWGGYRSGFSGLQDGGRYDPATDIWKPMPTAAAPPVRFNFSLVWTGTEAVLWGGDILGQRPTTGGRFNPATGLWSAISQLNVPVGRTSPSAVWTGHEIIFWGGGTASAGYPATHGRYDPAADTWSPVSPSGAPTGRAGHCATWNGSRMIVWGGESSAGKLGDGGIWSPETDTWTDISAFQVGAPPPRTGHTGIWTGTNMLVWGGRNATDLLKDTYTYTPSGTFYLYQRP